MRSYKNSVSLDVFGGDCAHVKIGDVVVFLQISPNTPRDNIDSIVRIAIDCDNETVIMRRGEATGTPYLKKEIRASESKVQS